MQLTDFCSEYWNANLGKFGSLQIMEFIEILYKQESLIKSYGMTDKRYEISYNELISTFCIRTFKNFMPMIVNLIKSMKTETYYEGEKCMTNIPLDLFKFVNEIFVSMEIAPEKEVCFAILGLSYKYEVLVI